MVRARMYSSIFVPLTGFGFTPSLDTWDAQGQWPVQESKDRAARPRVARAEGPEGPAVGKVSSLTAGDGKGRPPRISALARKLGALLSSLSGGPPPALGPGRPGSPRTAGSVWICPYSHGNQSYANQGWVTPTQGLAWPPEQGQCHSSGSGPLGALSTGQLPGSWGHICSFRTRTSALGGEGRTEPLPFPGNVSRRRSRTESGIVLTLRLRPVCGQLLRPRGVWVVGCPRFSWRLWGGREATRQWGVALEQQLWARPGCRMGRTPGRWRQTRRRPVTHLQRLESRTQVPGVTCRPRSRGRRFLARPVSRLPS